MLRWRLGDEPALDTFIQLMQPQLQPPDGHQKQCRYDTMRAEQTNAEPSCSCTRSMLQLDHHILHDAVAVLINMTHREQVHGEH